MKTIIAGILCISLVGCGATSNPPTITPPTTTTPTPSAGVLLAAEAVVGGCLVAETSVSPAAFTWLSQECAPTAASVLSVVEASGPLAKIQAAINSLQASYMAIPAGTLTPHDQQVVTASLVAFQLVLTTYEAATGQTLTAGSPIILAAFEVRSHVRKLNLTPEQKARLEALRKRAVAASKKKKK
jgi:hypothetical protein